MCRSPRQLRAADDGDVAAHEALVETGAGKRRAVGGDWQTKALVVGACAGTARSSTATELSSSAERRPRRKRVVWRRRRQAAARPARRGGPVPGAFGAAGTGHPPGAQATAPASNVESMRCGRPRQDSRTVLGRSRNCCQPSRRRCGHQGVPQRPLVVEAASRSTKMAS